ncbi:helicase C-terminal domain-containing protein [Halosegnis longus]|uniref:helicase C-terminal domain-containing protein n=1 Tax=Halosegnis longus TaxID=2216012 RepID=UPI00129D30CA|nr:helicase C-terminal domain-containing protein [Halosegnis longus]
MTNTDIDYTDYTADESGFRGYLRDLADEQFPFPGYREYQDEVLYHTLWKLFIDDADNVIIDAPTGVGKSPLLVAVGEVNSVLYENQAGIESYFELDLSVLDGSSFYTTPQKQLRDQLAADETLQDAIEMLKSRRDYSCAAGGTNCADCPIRNGNEQSCMGTSGCTYWEAKEDAMSASQAVLTFAMLIIDNNLPMVSQEGEQMSFGNRDIVRVDEAHGLEGQIASLFAGFTVSERTLPDAVLSDFEHRVDWSADRFEDVENILADIARQCTIFVDDWEDNPSMRHEVEQCETFLDRYNYCLDEISEDRPWVVNVDTIERTGRSNSKYIELQPVDVDRFLEKMIWSRGNKRILSSATIPYRNDVETWADRIGLPGETELIRCPMPFPVENRRIHTNTVVGSMSGDGCDEHWPEIISTIEEIHSHHTGENGIIHTASYGRAKRLAQSLGHHKVFRHKQDMDATEALEAFQESSADILATPSMTEGVDLEGDMARWQVLLKVPFRSPGDERVSYLLNERSAWDWYNQEAMLDCAQAVGRAVRGPDDAASFYVLDAKMEQLMHKVEFPDWYEEAVTDDAPDHWAHSSKAPWRETVTADA